MISSLARLAHYGFNQRRLTMDDFYTICEQENIKVLREDVSWSFFMTVDSKKFIVLSNSLNPTHEKFVAYHELAHAICSQNLPTACGFYGLQDSQMERDADAFASIALIPRHSIEIVKKIIDTRMKFFDLYNLSVAVAAVLLLI